MFDQSPAVSGLYSPPAFHNALASPLEFMLDRIAIALELPDGKRQQAIERYESVGRFLNESEHFAGWLPDIFPQGSFRIGTTVKPWKDAIHDLDFVVLVRPPYGQPTPAELFNRLYQCLASDGTYKKMLSPKRRCARLTYANDFYLDILPAVPDPMAVHGGELLVPDRELRCFKASNPVGFADWFKDRGVVLFSEHRAMAKRVEPVPSRDETLRPLTRSVQLMKRHRDVCCERDGLDPPISILLTTLAAHAYGGQSDIYDAIDTILYGIQRMIPPKGRLVVKNPKNPNEDFSERWDNDAAAYQDFLEWLTTFANDWRELRSLTGQKLQSHLLRLFGEKPTEAAFSEYGESLRKSRDSGALGISRAAGLVAVTQPATATVRSHTFHGEDD